MDNVTRIKALARLAQSRGTDALQALQVELEDVVALLAKSTSYEVLEHSLDVLGAIGFRFSEPVATAIDAFNKSIEARTLEYSPEYDGIRSEISKYRNAQTLLAKGIEVLSGLRYLQTRRVAESLLWASAHSSERVSKDGMDALASLAKYNITVFSGNESRPGIGAKPQLHVVDLLESMDGDALICLFRGVIKLLEGMLSSAMERTEWSSSAVTLYRGVTPPTSEILAVRSRSIDLLRKLYALAPDLRSKLTVIRTLNAATRPEPDGVIDPEYVDMIANNACSVLSFFTEIVPTADLQMVQKIEHCSYWIFFHTKRQDVKEAALAVKASIDANDEYEIFRTLVGFEGIFGEWSSENRSAMRERASQERRGILADGYARSIDGRNFEQWRGRILKFAATESEDLATFPIFYRFLQELAKHQPKLALSLLVNNSDVITPFAIPLLKGLWDGEERAEVRKLLAKWTADARPSSSELLYAGARMFLSTDDVDLDLLQTMFDKARELSDTHVLNQIAAVSIVRFANSQKIAAQLKGLFLDCLQVLTQHNNANWVRDIWFRDEAKALVALLDGTQVSAVLKNLSILRNVDYQAEEILSELAKIDPAQVIEFFCRRAMRDDHGTTESILHEPFEAIPFDFHHLQEPLSKYPEVALRTVHEHFRKDKTLFQFRGAKLLQSIFPVFSETFEGELMSLVQSGDESNLEFVLAVLSAYSGEEFLYPLCKAIVKRLSPGSPLLRSVEFVLESTNIVMGEHGMSEAYEKKRVAALSWLDDPDDNVRAFARSYISDLEAMRDGERRRETEGIALRKFRHGES